MTDEELAEIRKRVGFIAEMARITDRQDERYVAADYCRDVPALLAEVERLRATDDLALEGVLTSVEAMRHRMRRMRAQLLALRVIAERVAAMDDSWYLEVESDADGVPAEYQCPHCRVDMNRYTATHAADCPVTQARAWLAANPADTADDDPKPSDSSAI